MNNKTTPKDFFLHLGATITLYIVAVALMNLFFASINYAFPDALANYFSSNSIVWPTSMLIILTPTLYVLEWLIKKSLVNFPEKKELWIRRWRIYLTLFLAGAVILGDLIYLLNTFLNGEITSRFVYKVLVVLAVSAVIFAYYLLERKADEGRKFLWQKILAIIGIVLVVGAIVCGFLIVGSPAKQRALRFDQQRVNDLTNIQWQITNYYQSKGKLPASLDDLNDSISGYKAALDPQTNQPYEYNPKEYSSVAPNAFELCATFTYSSQDLQGRGGYNGYNYDTIAIPAPGGKVDSWNHSAGHYCFQRSIDPARYPLINK